MSGIVDFERYGGRKASFYSMQARALDALGMYRGARDIPWAEIHQLVFVCKGNICRSPYAAERARHSGARAVSCGLGATDGSAADPDAVHNASRRGIDLSAHRSRAFDARNLWDSDLVILFEPVQLVEARRRIGARAIHLTLLGLWSQPRLPYLHDPYGLSDRYFERCYAVIDSGVRTIVQQMSAQLRNRTGHAWDER